MSTKKKRLLVLGVIVVNLVVILLIKSWGVWRLPPYSLPSKIELQQEAAVIAEKLSAGDVDYLVSRYDLNAINFFQQGVANWVDEAKQQEANRKLEASLVGVKKCVCKRCYSSDRMNGVEFELTFNDGEKREAGAILYKDKRGKIGIAVFAVHELMPPETKQ
jgi:hypothetical protein